MLVIQDQSSTSRQPRKDDSGSIWGRLPRNGPRQRFLKWAWIPRAPCSKRWPGMNEPSQSRMPPSLETPESPKPADPEKIKVRVLSFTWTPRVCRIMAFWAVFGGFGLLFYIHLGSRYKGEVCGCTFSQTAPMPKSLVRHTGLRGVSWAGRLESYRD